MHVRTRNRIEKVALPLAAAFVALVVWDVAVRVSGTNVFPSPARVVAAFGELAHTGKLSLHVVSSGKRVAAGYLAAVVLGLPLGLVMGTAKPFASALNPLVQFLRPISPIAWIPIAIVLFGTSSAGPIFLVFIGAFFPIVVSAMNAVRNVEPIFQRVGENFGLSRRALLWRVTLPGALPQILTGLRIGLGIAWIVLVAAEMVAVTSGLGYMVLDARNAGQRYDLVVAGMLIIGVIGLALDALLRRAEAVRALKWGFREHT